MKEITFNNKNKITYFYKNVITPLINSCFTYYKSNFHPFGLKHQNYNTGIRKYKKVNSIPRPIAINKEEQEYKYKYQGQERQDELGLNWDSFKWRNYDYALGRFMSVDPLAEEYS